MTLINRTGSLKREQTFDLHVIRILIGADERIKLHANHKECTYYNNMEFLFNCFIYLNYRINEWALSSKRGHKHSVFGAKLVRAHSNYHVLVGIGNRSLHFARHTHGDECRFFVCPCSDDSLYSRIAQRAYLTAIFPAGDDSVTQDRIHGFGGSKSRTSVIL